MERLEQMKKKLVEKTQMKDMLKASEIIKQRKDMDRMKEKEEDVAIQ